MASERKRGRQRPAWGKIAVGLAALAGLAAAWRYTPLADYLTSERIREWARVVRHTPWAPFVIVAAYSPASFVLFPRPILTLLAVVSFGTWLGLVYAGAGIMLAALVTYYAGRYIGEKPVNRIAGDALAPATRVLREHGVAAIFALNMVPTPPFAVQGMIAGAYRVNVWHYALGSLLGMIPSLLAWTVFGRQVTHLIEDPSQISVWVIVAAIAVLAGVTWAVRRWFARMSAD
jgi:uncharacterized membrane protein YdjX (TVP38/TMEM64 family)